MKKSLFRLLACIMITIISVSAVSVSEDVPSQEPVQEAVPPKQESEPESEPPSVPASEPKPEKRPSDEAPTADETDVPEADTTEDVLFIDEETIPEALEEPKYSEAMFAPTAIIPAKTSVTLGVGDSVCINDWRIEPESAEANVTYSVSVPSIASVSADGTVTAKKAGSAVITLRADNNCTAKILLTVKKAPTSIKLSYERTLLAVGEEQSAKVTLSSGSATTLSFRIDSGSESIRIDPGTGKVHALKPGTAKVTVETHNHLSKSITFTVVGAPDSVVFDRDEFTLGVKASASNGFTLDTNDRPENEDYALRKGAKGLIVFLSSDNSAVSVDPDSGRITAIKEKAVSTISAVRFDGITIGSYTVYTTPEPTALSLSVRSDFDPEAGSPTLGVGETAHLRCTITPEDSVSTLKYTSSAKTIVSVDADGKITAKKTGKAKITVTAYNSVKSSIWITVKKKPSSVSLKADRTLLAEGETVPFTLKLSSGAAGVVRLYEETDNPAIEAEGKYIYAAHEGTETLTAETYNGKRATLPITVTGAPTGIDFSETKLFLAEKSTSTLRYTLSGSADPYPLANGAAGMVHFESSDNSIVSVDSISGKLKVLKPSDDPVTITATTYDGRCRATVSVTALPLPKAITLRSIPEYNPTTARATLIAGERAAIEVISVPENAMFSVTWSSSNTKVASVNTQGIVTAKKAGTAVITAKTSNGVKKKITITVKKPASSLKLASGDNTMGIGQTIDLSIRLPSGTKGACVFSDDPECDVLTVDPYSGVVTALSEGTETILCTLCGGASATIEITVRPAPERIEFVNAPTILGVGQSYAPQLRFTPENAYSPVTFEISPAVLMRSEGGILNAASSGNTIVTAHTYIEDVRCDTMINILPAPSSVWFEPNEITVNLVEDEPFILEPMIPKGTSAAFTYKLTSGKSVSIGENGMVTPLLHGTSVITVTTHNGKTATFTVHVFDPYLPERYEWITEPPICLLPEAEYTPEYTVFPEIAVTDIKWKTSNANIASVDSETGTVTAVAAGRATITGIFTRNPGLEIIYSVAVTTKQRCTTVPDRWILNADKYTDAQLASKINGVLSQIDLIRRSAYAELDMRLAEGTITQHELSVRKGIIDRAFDMYAFPWRTTKNISFWSNAYSGRGFYTNRIYFGLPYTQWSRTNNAEAVLRDKAFTPSGKGPYYLINTKVTPYHGNDCSGFVAQAIWGPGTAYSKLNTSGILSSKGYETVKSNKDMRPGDILCTSKHHVILFLYYTDDGRNSFVYLQQSMLDNYNGTGSRNNTVNVRTGTITGMKSSGYKLMRAKLNY